MRIVEINATNYGSTGNIMLQIADAARLKGHEVFVCFPKSRENTRKKVQNQIIIGNRFLRNVHRLIATWTGLHGCFSIIDTLSFLKKLDRLNPDLIQLHNLHSDYINLPLLFWYIKKKKIKVVWTLHDCWAFTGHCPYFTLAKCNKWKTGCNDCPSYKEYPESRIDNTKQMWQFKKKWFSGIENLTIVTPSNWLAELVGQSYLGEYPVRVINNGINLDVFKPIPSDFREKYGIKENQMLLLGVAFGWGRRKGLDVFEELAQRLNPDIFRLMLVGTNEDIDEILSESIISIHRTQNQEELAKIYTAADLFINPTREEVFGLVNVEANACGTPVITFRTGGSPECISELSGKVVECDDVESMVNAIVSEHNDRSFKREDCIQRAELFSNDVIYEKYVQLYEEMN